MVAHFVQDGGHGEPVNAFKERQLEPCCWERVADGWDEAGMVEHSGFSARHVSSLECFCIQKCFFPQVAFHGFGRSVHGDIHAQVSCAIVRFQDLESLLGLVGVRDNLIVIGPCSDSEYAVFVRVPCVYCGLTFFWVQGSSSGLNQLQPPLQLSLGSFYQYFDVS